MRIPSLCLVVLFILFGYVTPAAAQYAQAEVELGYNLYNTNCITCHGANGDSVSGVNLRSGQFRRISTDAELNRLIQTGIPGTAMPPGRFGTADLAGLVAYVRSMSVYNTKPAKGDAARGKSVFEGKGGCMSCHRVNGNGSRLAPDLSEVGAVRSPDAIERALVDSTSIMIPINRSIRAVTRGGKVITGRRLNEDTYTVQIIDSEEKLVSLNKADLKEYSVLKTSTMPSFKGTLTPAELDDVATYLRTLKGSR
jgi:putative heme-binding domain-containing protein